MINFFNVDCMDFMKSKPDGFYDLAIVDPPYGIGVSSKKQNNYGKCGIKHKLKNWDIVPSSEYWFELFRVSKNQIVWGGNYFTNYLKVSRCWISWYKMQEFSSNEFELAWTSFDMPSKQFNYSRVESYANQDKRHPTQKPIKLYRWTLLNFAKTGWNVLDTHGGSMTNAIACDMEGFDLDICEIDKEYFDDGVEAFYIHKMQFKLGDSPKERGEKNLIQLGLSFPKSDDTGI